MKAKKQTKSAIIDHLTRLYNRRFFDNCLKEIILKTKQRKQPLSLIMIDINDFKAINDTYGHPIGDQVLQQFAQIMRRAVRRIDLVCRYGGDKFVIISPGSSKKTTQYIANRIVNSVKQRKMVIDGGDAVYLNLSIGLATFPDDASCPKTLIKKADELLYEMKHQKRSALQSVIMTGVLQTKLVSPLLQDNIISRPRLVALLKENINKILILIIAGAGYGKTTLLAQGIKQIKYPMIYFDLDERDSILAVFIAHLIASINGYRKGIVTESKKLLIASENLHREWKALGITLINELLVLQRPLYIILDDYHTIRENSIVHDFVDFFINNIPDNIHLIIASRTTPPFGSLAKLRVKRSCCIIEQNALAFTKEEMAELFCSTYRIKRSDQSMTRLYDTTEGWISGIHAIMQGTQGREIGKSLNGYVRSGSDLFEYFAREILNRETPKTKNFLMRSSILRLMNPVVCDYILKRNDSGQILKRLHKNNLFVSVSDSHAEMYKYHHLFRRFLQNKHKEAVSRKEFAALSLRAAAFFVKHEDYDTAIEHYLDIDDLDRVIKIIEKIGLKHIWNGKFETVEDWLSHLSEAAINRHAWLLITRGHIQRHQGDLDGASTCFTKAKKLFERQMNKKGLGIALYGQGGMALYNGRYRQGLKLAEAAYQLFEKSRDNVGKAWIINLLAILSGSAGYTKSAMRYFKKGLRLAIKSNDVPVETALRNNLGMLYFESGDFYNAELCYTKVVELKPQMASTLHNLAMIQLHRGGLDKAESFVAKAIKLNKTYGNRISLLINQTLIAQLLVKRGQRQEAINLYRTIAQSARKLNNVLLFTIALTNLISIYVQVGSYAKAQETLDQLSQVKMPRTSKIYSYYLESEGSVLSGLGKISDAVQSYMKAVEINKRCGHNYDLMQLYYYIAGCFLKLKKYRKTNIYLRRSLKQSIKFGYDYFLSQQALISPALLNYALEKKIGSSNYIMDILDRTKPSMKVHSVKSADISKKNISVLMFGKFKIYRFGTAISRSSWRTKSLQAIFAYFVINHDKKFSRDQLLEIFWPKQQASTSLANLHRALYHIRQTVGECASSSNRWCIVYDKGKYFLNPEFDIWSDVRSFDATLKDADRLILQKKPDEAILRYEQACNLYQGMLLEEFYEDWVDRLRSQCQKKFVGLLGKVATQYFYRSNYTECIEVCQRILTFEPFDEEVNLLLMRAFKASNNRGAVIVQYQKLKKSLKTELGLEPSLRTREEYSKLLQ